MTCTHAEYVVGSGVNQPAAIGDSHDHFRRLAFYNVGWKHDSKKHNKERLAAEISHNVVTRRVDAIGISEVFNIKKEGLHEQRIQIMAHLLESLNSSAAQPASSASSSVLGTNPAQFVWAGRCDGHYIFLWNTTRLYLKKYDFISCNIEEHPWRKCQYLQFQHPDALEALPLHVCHNHNPSSDNLVLTNGRRKRIFSALWSHVLQNQPGSAAQPAVVLGGDFNCTAFQWTQCLKEAIGTQKSRRTVQVCTSKTIPHHHGDRAIVINAFALQENSGWGKSFSRTAFTDDHDVVFVPLSWAHFMPTSPTSPQLENRSFTPMPRCVWAASRPENYPDNMSLSSAVQPAQEDPHDLGNSHTPVDSHISTISMQLENLSVKAQEHCMSDSEIVDELSRMHAKHGNILVLEDYPDNMSCFRQHVGFYVAEDSNDLGNVHTPVETVEEAPTLVLPSIETPLYNAFLDKLNNTDDTDLMEQLNELFVFDKLKYQKPFHSAEQPALKSGDPYSLGLRLEHLLSVTQTQRAHHISRLAEKGDDRAREAQFVIFNADDMRDIMNNWRKQPHTWMDANSLQLLAKTKTQQHYHQVCKRKFNVMLFQMFGNKALVDAFIRFPICSVEQPASMLKEFTIAWRSYNDNEDAERARETSKKQPDPRVDRLSKQIYTAKQRQARGKWIADWIQLDSNNWWSLNRQDQQLWHEYEKGDIHRHIAELKNRQRPSFAGAGQSIATFMSSAVQPDKL